MKKDFFAIYDALTAGMDESGGRIRAAAGYSRWSLAETDRPPRYCHDHRGRQRPRRFSPPASRGFF